VNKHISNDFYIGVSVHGSEINDRHNQQFYKVAQAREKRIEYVKNKLAGLVIVARILCHVSNLFKDC
jgi:hypothetical protein